MQKHQKHRNVTLSLSMGIINDLHLFVKKGEISRFVEEAITEKLGGKKVSLEQQYIQAAQDEERNKTFAEWENLVGDGLNEQNEW